MKKSSKILVLALVGVLCLSSIIAPISAAASKSVWSFTDLEDDWYIDAIKSAVNNDLLAGYWDNTIQPQGNITRAEVATVLTKALSATEKADLSQFEDADKNEWYYDFLAKAVNMQVMSGNGYGFVMPNDNITREEAATVIARAFCYFSSGKNVLKKFPDANEVSDWARPYVEALVENDIMAGIYGKLEPKKPMTRAEFAQIMSNITDDYITSAKKAVTSDYDGSVIVKVPGVTLKDMTVENDLIIADGVGTGNFTMENVVVKGDVVIRGGGPNSINILDKCKINGNVIVCNRNSVVRIHSDIIVLPKIIALTPFILDGDAEHIIANANISIEVRGFAQRIDANDSLKVTGRGTVEEINANADDSTISGNADVKDVLVNANNVTVTIAKARVTAGKNTSGVKAGNKNVKPGETVVVPDTSIGGVSHGSSSSSVAKKTLVYTIVDNGESYDFIQDPANDPVTNFEKTQYNVTVKFESAALPLEETGTADVLPSLNHADEVATIKSSSEAIAFAKKIFGILDIEKLMITIDSKNFVTSMEDYNNYKTELKALFVFIFDEDYAVIDAARREAANTLYEGDLSQVGVWDIYNVLLGEKTTTTEDVIDMVNNALDRAAGNTVYSDVIWEFATDSDMLNKIF